jgi:hypothetical protein
MGRKKKEKKNKKQEKEGEIKPGLMYSITLRRKNILSGQDL